MFARTKQAVSCLAVYGGGAALNRHARSRVFEDSKDRISIISQNHVQRGVAVQIRMRRFQPNSRGLWFVEEFMENLQGPLHGFERRLKRLDRWATMDGFVIQLESFGEPFELYAHVISHLLRVNAPGRFIVQLGEGYPQASAAVEYSAQFRPESRDLADPPPRVWWGHEKSENGKQKAEIDGEDTDSTNYHGAGAGAGERGALGEMEYVRADVPDLRVAEERRVSELRAGGGGVRCGAEDGAAG